jgi:four helix bundle protein
MIALEDLKVYQLAMEIGDEIWVLLDLWLYFAKDTLGKQLTKSADTIGLNIAEGYGRFYFKENKNFCYYARV